MDSSEKGDFKSKYRTLKRKLKSLVYEHELLTEQLEQSQKKLLRVSRDRSFLLDRMLQYERVNDSSSESDATDLSDSDAEKPKKKVPPSPGELGVSEKKKKYQKKEKKATSKKTSKEDKMEGKSISSIETPTASMPMEIFNTDREGASDEASEHEGEPDKSLVIDVR